MATTTTQTSVPRPAIVPNGARARDFAWIVAAALLFYALNVDFQLLGDSAVYADNVLRADFHELTLHLGYYAVIYALHHTVGRLLGLPIQETMVWLNVVVGSLALGLMYRLAYHFLGTRRDALLCVAILAFSGRVLNNATSSEMYMLQTCLVMGSFLLFVNERVFWAGLVAGAALLVSPLSAFAYLFFPVYDVQRSGRVRWAVLLGLAGAALLVYGPFLVLEGRELLWGERGLLVINAISPFDWGGMLETVPRYQFKQFTVLVLLLLPALTAVRKEKRFLILTLAVAIPHLYIVSKLTRDNSEENVFILSTDFFFACWLVLGWRELARLRFGRQLGWALLATHLALLLAAREIFAFEPHRQYAAQMRAVAQRYLAGRDATMITDWGRAQVLTFYGRPVALSALERDPLYRQVVQIENPDSTDARRLRAKELYLMDPWRAGGLARLLSSRARVSEQRRQHSLLLRAAAQFRLRCTPLADTPHPLYRCVQQAGGTPPA